MAAKASFDVRFSPDSRWEETIQVVSGEIRTVDNEIRLLQNKRARLCEQFNRALEFRSNKLFGLLSMYLGDFAINLSLDFLTVKFCPKCDSWFPRITECVCHGRHVKYISSTPKLQIFANPVLEFSQVEFTSENDREVWRYWTSKVVELKDEFPETIEFITFPAPKYWDRMFVDGFVLEWAQSANFQGIVISFQWHHSRN